MVDKDIKWEIEFAQNEIRKMRKSQLRTIFLVTLFPAITISTGLNLALDPHKLTGRIGKNGRIQLTLSKQQSFYAGCFSVALGAASLLAMGTYVNSLRKKIKVEKAFIKAKQ